MTLSRSGFTIRVVAVQQDYFLYPGTEGYASAGWRIQLAKSKHDVYENTHVDVWLFFFFRPRMKKEALGTFRSGSGGAAQYSYLTALPLMAALLIRTLPPIQENG